MPSGACTTANQTVVQISCRGLPHRLGPDCRLTAVLRPSDFYLGPPTALRLVRQASLYADA
jgi:hypothetical protein